MPDINEILKAARPRERTVLICTDGGAAGEVEDLQEQLARVSADWEPSGMADVHPGRAVAEKLVATRERAKASEVPFTLRYIGDRAYTDLVAAHPSEDPDRLFDEDSFTPALIAACCVDPVMTLEQTQELFEVINGGEIKKLFEAAWDVHNGAGSAGFSLAASALLAALGGEK